MATVSKWSPFGVSLNITATAGTVTRKSATQYTVKINASWETYWDSAKTDYGMTASSGGKSITLNKEGTKSSGSSGSFVGTYSISGNGSATKTITVTFKNFNSYHDDSATKSVSFNVNVPEWTSYQVTYYANGSNVTGMPSSQTKWKDQSLTLSTTRPKRTGYSFLGWATSSTATAANSNYDPGDKYTSNAALKLYAVWTTDTYRITYNANGGTGAPGYQTKEYGKTLKLSTTKPTRMNYAFLGWSTSKTATTATYSAGGNYTANSAATLYAVWEMSYVKPTVENLAVTRVRSGFVYTKTETVIEPLKGTLMEGVRTKTGEQVYEYETADTIIYYCIVAEEVESDTGVKEKQLVYYEVSNGGVRTWVPADDGNAIHVTFRWYTFLPTTSVKIEVTSANGDVIDEYSADVGTETSLSEYLARDLLDPDGSYVVTITISDKQTDGSGDELVIIKNIEGNKFVIDFRKGGTGVAIGKAAELDGWFDVAYDMSLHKNLQFDYRGIVYGHKADGNRIEVFDTQSSYGNTTVGWGNYNLKSGNLNLYGHDVYIGVSNIASPGLQRTYLRRGDSILVKLYTAGYVTNSGTAVRFIIPLSIPVFGNPTATLTSVSELVLRQNSKYTHGSAWNSSSDTYTSVTIGDGCTMSIDDGRKDKYTFDGLGDRLIYANLPVTITLTNTKDAVNNETIGIRFTGTVTFT